MTRWFTRLGLLCVSLATGSENYHFHLVSVHYYFRLIERELAYLSASVFVAEYRTSMPGNATPLSAP